MSKETIVDKLILKLKEVQLDETKLAATTGDTGTTGTTSGSTLQTVIVTEIIPKNYKVSYSAIGAPVLVEQKGKEVAAPDDDYNLVNGKTITVVKGKLTAEINTPAEVTSGTTGQTGTTGTTTMAKVIVNTLDLKAYPWDVCIADQKKAGYSDEDAKKICGKIKATNMSKEQYDDLKMAMSTADSVKSALTRAGLDISKAGSYCLNFSIGDDGSMTYGTLQTNTYQDLMLAKEKEIGEAVDTKVKELETAYETKMKTQKDNYEKVIKTLNSNTKTINTNPANSEKEVVKPITKADLFRAEVLAMKKAKGINIE
jgi:hypothetical protein